MLIGQDIRVTLGKRPVLHGIDIEARAGQFTAIVGPNGSGKTTLMRTLTGEIAADGVVVLNGRGLSGMKPWETASLRAVLPQATPLAFPFRVAEVVRLGLEAGVFARRRHIVGEALAAVDMTRHAAHPYQALSGGEQQRVQMARVLAQVWEPTADGSPRWLFLDEPVANLDIAHQLQVMQVARSFADRGGGVVAVMHDLNLTAAFADHVVLLEAGRVTARGTPEQTFRAEVLSRVYNCPIRVGTPPAGSAFCVFPDIHAQMTGA